MLLERQGQGGDFSVDALEEGDEGEESAVEVEDE